MTRVQTVANDQTTAVLSLIDSDVHNYVNSIDELMPFLSASWQVYVRQSGFTGPPGPTYPKGFAQAAAAVGGSVALCAKHLLVRGMLENSFAYLMG